MMSNLLGLRQKTDYRISGSLIAAAVISWILWTFYLVEAIFHPIAIITGITGSLVQGLTGLGGFIATVPVAYLEYLIVNRRNLHFRRSELLLSEILSRIRSGIPVTETSRLFLLGSAERDLWITGLQEKERSGYLWSLLTLIPFMGGLFLLYALYRVSSDFRSHEQRESMTFHDLRRMLAPSPIPSSPYNTGTSYGWKAYSFHDSIGFVFAGILTAGLFSIYWLSVSLQEPQPHFQIQAQMEDEINRMLSGSGASMISTSGGGPGG